MKIVAVETLRIAARPNLVWVRLRTDEGITGLGESWFGSGPVEADRWKRMCTSASRPCCSARIRAVFKR